MITTQKVAGILRKAGCSFSKYHASGMVKGWGRSTAGYTVRTVGGTIRVDYECGSDARGHGGEVRERLGKAAEILRGAGLEVLEVSGRYPEYGTAWLEVSEAQPAALAAEEQ